jgi:hypothetical protein
MRCCTFLFIFFNIIADIARMEVAQQQLDELPEQEQPQIEADDAQEASNQDLESIEPTAEQRQQTATIDFIQKRLALSVEAPIEDFKAFRSAMRHPAVALGIDTTGMTAGSPDNLFTRLSDDVLTAMTDLQSSMDDLVNWKNGLMRQNLPASMKYTLTMLFSKLFRRWDFAESVNFINY